MCSEICMDASGENIYLNAIVHGWKYSWHILNCLTRECYEYIHVYPVFLWMHTLLPLLFAGIHSPQNFSASTFLRILFLCLGEVFSLVLNL